MSATIRDELEAHHIIVSNEAYDLARASAEENSLGLLESLVESDAISKEIACRIWSNRLGRAYVDPI